MNIFVFSINNEILSELDLQKKLIFVNKPLMGICMHTASFQIIIKMN